MAWRYPICLCCARRAESTFGQGPRSGWTPEFFHFEPILTRSIVTVQFHRTCDSVGRAVAHFSVLGRRGSAVRSACRAQRDVFLLFSFFLLLPFTLTARSFRLDFVQITPYTVDECWGPSPIGSVNPTRLWDFTLGSTRAIVGTSQDQPSEPTSAPGRVKCGHLAAYLRSGVTMAACFGFSRCLLCQLIALSQIFGEKLALTLFMATAAFAHSSANSADPHSEFISPRGRRAGRRQSGCAGTHAPAFHTWHETPSSGENE